MKTFLDTNILLRYFEEMNVVVDFMMLVSKSSKTYVLPSVVISETAWTLQKFYKIPKEKVIKFVESIIAVDKFKIIYKYNFPNALYLYKNVNVKLTDCMIWSFMDKGDQIVSFDKDFDKLPGIKRVEPKDLLA